MAPTAPQPRSILKKPSSSTTLSGRGAIPHKSTTSDSAFSTTKKDKRTIKSSLFLSRITKSRPKRLKRRRPSKKLVTSLQSLDDALGDLAADIEEGKGGKWEESGRKEKKSLKSKPGAMKKREKVERMERERFGKNMAQMVQGIQRSEEVGIDVHGEKEGSGRIGTSARWAALRGFIQQTMEQKEEFRKT